jgi:hypothetical protein
MSNKIQQRISPEVDQVIKPCITAMSDIALVEENMGEIDQGNVSPAVKMAKRRCVHIIWRKGDFVVTVKPVEGNKMVCSVCGAEIGTEFNDDAIDDYFNCLKRVNQLLFFGMFKGLQARPIQGLIALKEMLPDAARLHKAMNQFVAKDDKDQNVKDNLGAEFATNELYRSITGFTGF